MRDGRSRRRQGRSIQRRREGGWRDDRVIGPSGGVGRHYIEGVAELRSLDTDSKAARRTSRGATQGTVGEAPVTSEDAHRVVFEIKRSRRELCLSGGDEEMVVRRPPQDLWCSQ